LRDFLRGFSGIFRFIDLFVFIGRTTTSESCRKTILFAYRINVSVYTISFVVDVLAIIGISASGLTLAFFSGY
jgi:hypothetical protein